MFCKVTSFRQIWFFKTNFLSRSYHDGFFQYFCHKGTVVTSYRNYKINRKKDKDRTIIQNRRLISPLNVDMKIISKSLSKRINNVLP